MRTYSSQRSDRVGALSGILSVLLTFGGFAVLGGAAGGLLDLSSSRGEVARHFADPVPSMFWIGAYLEVIGVVLFIPFAACLAGAFQRHDRDASTLSLTVFGSALFLVVAGLISFSAGATAYYNAGGRLDVDVLVALAQLRSFAFTIGWAVNALFLATAATLILTTNALPRWLGWVAVALSLMLLAGLASPTSDLAQMPPMLTALWILAVSVTLLRQAPAYANRPPTPVHV